MHDINEGQFSDSFKLNLAKQSSCGAGSSTSSNNIGLALLAWTRGPAQLQPCPKGHLMLPRRILQALVLINREQPACQERWFLTHHPPTTSLRAQSLTHEHLGISKKCFWHIKCLKVSYFMYVSSRASDSCTSGPREKSESEMPSGFDKGWSQRTSVGRVRFAQETLLP